MTVTIQRKHVLLGLAAIAAIGVIASSVYFFIQYRKAKALLRNPAEAAKTDNQQIIAAVARVVDVPSAETPTVASVTDLSKLAGQPFFAKAQNGDRVIFYPDSKRAILYRPSTGKIIEMSAVAGGESGSVAGAQTTPEPSTQTSFTGLASPSPTVASVRQFTLAIYNGTETPKLANAMETKLKGGLPEATVVKKGNAAENNRTATLIVDLTGTHGTETDALQRLIGGTTGPMPAGEEKPDADVLIIIGSDWKP